MLQISMHIYETNLKYHSSMYFHIDTDYLWKFLMAFLVHNIIGV